MTEGGESFYPLYDNGRSLFYEDTESFARKAAADPRAFATTFGYVGTYWDHARDIAAKGVRFGDLLNLDVDPRTIRALLDVYKRQPVSNASAARISLPAACAPAS